MSAVLLWLQGFGLACFLIGDGPWRTIGVILVGATTIWAARRGAGSWAAAARTLIVPLAVVIVLAYVANLVLS